jgi:uncharacterized membrane protein YqjE
MDTAADRGPARPPHTPVPPGPGVSSSRVPHDMPIGEPSFLEPLERVIATLKRMATNYALLGVLDMRRAAIQFAWLMGAGIFITVLLVTAWLAGVVALAVIMIGRDMSWPAVLGIAALLNILGAGIIVWRVKHVFDEKPFAATLRQLKAQPPANEKQP